MRNFWLAWLLLVCASRGGAAVAADDSSTVLVFAAASLTNVLDELSTAFTGQTKVPVKSSLAASSVLAKQIEAGAPADVFFSADLDWMDYLEQRKLLKPGSRHDVAGNRLVLIAPADSRVTVKIVNGVDLAPALGPQGRIATGDPDSVPVGKYARAALQKLGAWDKVSGRIVRAESVRAALAFVARGEAPLGIVYRTDALAEKRVRIVAEFPQDTHPPITYPIAVTTHGGPAAQQFVDFTRAAAAAEIFRKYGFERPHELHMAPAGR
ncbi:MAG: molybdenum transporter molybdenum-binding protein ModA [Gammaproteobacteria bacterium]|jgi:molybdate transport system substrate-binding protein|nr:molybdenum transporter molybdenum-binding protein ModA [Gammaproteobacteria bacterium]